MPYIAYEDMPPDLSLAIQAAREDERLACWKIADKERTALKNACPEKAAWLVAFDIANAIKMRGVVSAVGQSGETP